uniref:Uncharacterized protein n=1 Tax=viral metagenome TaxID=1070528 RepID=A0A6M3L6I6_9ZZZZ
MLIIKDILYHRRKYFIEKVKAPLQKAVENFGEKKTKWVTRFLALIEMAKMARKYPVPTKDNLVFNNSKIMLDILDDFCKYFAIPQKKLMLVTAIRMLIDENEHDGVYAWLYDWFILELIKRGWKPERRGTPMYRYWNGPLWDDNFTETVPDWFVKRANELITEAEKNQSRLQEKRDNGELWYDNLEKMKTLDVVGRIKKGG